MRGLHPELLGLGAPPCDVYSGVTRAATLETYSTNVCDGCRRRHSAGDLPLLQWMCQGQQGVDFWLPTGPATAACFAKSLHGNCKRSLGRRKRLCGQAGAGRSHSDYGVVATALWARLAVKRFTTELLTQTQETSAPDKRTTSFTLERPSAGGTPMKIRGTVVDWRAAAARRSDRHLSRRRQSNAR